MLYAYLIEQKIIINYGQGLLLSQHYQAIFRQKTFIRESADKYVMYDFAMLK